MAQASQSRLCSGKSGPRIPAAPKSIQKGSSLADLLGGEAIECLAHNIARVHPAFDADAFQRTALDGLAPLAILQRGRPLARVLRAHLPECYTDAIQVLLRSLTPPQTQTDDLGLGVFFYSEYPPISSIPPNRQVRRLDCGRPDWDSSATRLRDLSDAV